MFFRESLDLVHFPFFVPLRTLSNQHMETMKTIRIIVLSVLFFGLVPVGLFAEEAFAQGGPDSLVFISGRIINAKDSTPVVAKIRFRKLPHGDDVGVSVSTKTGTYQMPVLNERSYGFEGVQKMENELNPNFPERTLLFVIYKTKITQKS